MDRHNVGTFYGMSGCEDIPWSSILSQIPDVISHLDDCNSPIPKKTFYSIPIYDWDEKSTKEETIDAELMPINQKYIDFFGIEILKGKMIDENNMAEVLINETAAKALKWESPIGKQMTIGGKVVTVKGVIKDIYHQSPIYPVTPTVFSLNPSDDQHFPCIFRVKEGAWDKVCQALIEEAKKTNPDAKLTLSKMDEVYEDYMRSELKLVRLLSIVSVVCILISVFGVFSLITLSCQQRRKEVAIRKVNGASVGMILNLFIKEYTILLIIASCTAFSVGYVIMKHWLDIYMKQTSISWWVYAVIFVMMAFIIFLSIIWRVWKTARQNPAEVIKSE